MADSAVAITAGTGTNIDTFTQSGGDHRQAIVNGDATNAYTAGVFGAGYLRISDEPRQIFYDPFDAAPDTTNLWTTTNSGGGTAPGVTAGILTVGTGTTANGYAHVVSIPTFKPTVPAWLGFSFAISMTDLAAPTAFTYRFWGAGTAPGTPTAALPLTDAIGFELATDGKMYAVVYIAGSRTAIQDLSAATGNSTQPTNTASHRYGVYYRTDRSYFFIDTLDTIVATTAFQAPAVQTLPVRIQSVAGTTGPGASGIVSCTGLAVWDTGKNATQLADGTFPFRKATVSSTGSLRTARPPHVSATKSNASLSASSFTVLASNASRQFCTIYNDSSNVLYLDLTGGTASTTSYSVQVPAGGFYELSTTSFIYTGLITAISLVASGTCRVTEWT